MVKPLSENDIGLLIFAIKVKDITLFLGFDSNFVQV